MKLGFVADVHVGNLDGRHGGGVVRGGLNQRCREVLATLERAYARAAELEVGHMVILGDLFDRSSETRPQMVAAVQQIIGRIKTTVVLGNHDQESTDAGDNALAPLAPVAQVIERPDVVDLGQQGRRGGWEVELVCVPFQPGPAKSWLPGAVELALEGRPVQRQPPDARLLALHLGIDGPETPPFLKGKDDSIELGHLFQVMKACGITAAFAGNWHDRRAWRRPDGLRVLQVGTLAPTSLRDAGMDNVGTLAVVSCGLEPAGEIIETIPGPRFIDVRGQTVKLPQVDPKDGWSLRVRMTVPPEQAAAASRVVAEAKEAGRICGAVVDLDEGVAKAAARTAAVEARNAKSLDGAIEAFVADYPFEEGVDRDRVRNRTLAFLEGAS